jgi:protein-L-isoaspartate(D-aspartate) O-methyltransferase
MAAVGDFGNAVAARSRMVHRLLELGCNRRVVAAIARLQREQFLSHFWSQTPVFMKDGPDEAEEYFVGDPPDGAALELLYDVDRAHGVNRVGPDPGWSTSTASAPRVLAAQAEALWLEPGMSVLEIGTGIGYFAALLAELVGPSGRVVSVEVAPEIAALARERLTQAGYSRVEVITGDGHGGAPNHAQFDRIVCSVGCTDVARAWLDQVAPGGFALVPLLHGAVHPMLRVDGQGRGVVIMRSGYIRIQGTQDDAALWPRTRRRLEFDDSMELPGTLAEALRIEPERDRIRGRREWDLDFWVAINDQRSGRALLSLAAEDGSCAAIRVDDNLFRWGGPAGPALRDSLLQHAEQWTGAGTPRLEDYAHRFVRRSERPPDPQPGRWMMTRVDHHQVIELDPLIVS